MPHNSRKQVGIPIPNYPEKPEKVGHDISDFLWPSFRILGLTRRRPCFSGAGSRPRLHWGTAEIEAWWAVDMDNLGRSGIRDSGYRTAQTDQKLNRTFVRNPEPAKFRAPHAAPKIRRYEVR